MIEVKTVEELHQLTREELENYCFEVMKYWNTCTTVRDYRKTIGDDHNPYLLTCNIEEEE